MPWSGTGSLVSGHGSQNAPKKPACNTASYVVSAMMFTVACQCAAYGIDQSLKVIYHK